MRIAAFLLVGLAAVALPRAVQAAVEVSFVNPERYCDAGFDQRYGPASREPVQRRIREHLERLGARHLAPGQTLSIRVLDIDLAGQFEWWRPYGYNVRVFRDVAWPRIVVQYTLSEDGRTLVSAEESIADLNYQMRPAARLSRDLLRYEKEMLDDWFRARFVRFRPPAG